MDLLRIISLSLLACYVLFDAACSVGWHRSLRWSRSVRKYRGSREDLQPGSRVRHLRVSMETNPQGVPEGHLRVSTEAVPPVSLVIPVRNEEENIGRLLDDLAAQDYPPGACEVIVVDDHSEDRTREIVRDFQGVHPRIRLLELDASGSGKKAALRKGIEAASHNLILNTDGDCRVPEGWIREMVSGFSDPGIKMVIGPVEIEPRDGLFASMQSLEQFSLVAVSAGSAGIGNPLLCSAANLGYYRDDFLRFRAEQTEMTVSGDDVFLMLWLKKRHPGSIRFSASRGSLIRTLPVRTLGSFARQRIRWASKGRYYRDFSTVFSALLVYGFNLLLLLLLLAFLLSPLLPVLQGSSADVPRNREYLQIFAILLAGRSVADLVLLLPVLRHFSRQGLLRCFLPLEIVYFLYVSLTGLAGQFTPLHWKGRKVRACKQMDTVGSGQ